MGCVFSYMLIFQDIIYKVKTAFNNEFDAAYKQKEFEIARIKERNVRIQEIILDLELEEPVWQPEFDDYEKPERILVVENSEVLATYIILPFFLLTFPRALIYPSYCLHYWKQLHEVAFSVTSNKNSWHSLNNNEDLFYESRRVQGRFGYHA